MRTEVVNIYCLGRVSQNIKRFHHLRLRTLSSSAQPQCAVEAPKPFESIPGLSGLPLIGPLHHFIPGIGKIGLPENFPNMLDRLHKEFGPVVKMHGVFRRASVAILYEPEHYTQEFLELYKYDNKKDHATYLRRTAVLHLYEVACLVPANVYKAEDVTPLRPGFEVMVYYREQLRKDVYNGVYGLTTAQGAQWREFRTKVNPALLKPKLIKLYAAGLDEIAKEMVTRLVNLPTAYIQENFEVEMTKFSLESIGLVALGARLNCLKDEVTEDHPAAKLMKAAKDVIDLGFKMDLTPMPLWKLFQTPNLKKFVNTMDTQWNISTTFIQQAREKIKNRGHDIPEEEKSIIEKLLAIDEKVAIMMANEMLFAGIDTVAFATTGLLYELAINQNVQDNLRKAIHTDDSNRRYLKACLKEALRLYPVVTANIRRTTKDHVVAGYHIPKDIDVIAPNEYLSKTEKHYPRPKEFIPERWLADKSDPLYYGNTHPMVTLPFGFGIRMCIGRRIAELEIETLVHNLVKHHVIKWNGPPLKVITRVMNKFKEPYHFEFEACK